VNRLGPVVSMFGREVGVDALYLKVFAAVAART
jgi:hypothetical protein